ncbi:MAG TPA: hypothetical protein VHW23_15405 [Kofleriaceae bacterium]|nr:hypothetical protein [Kofleriaceae bacterium]
MSQPSPPSQAPPAPPSDPASAPASPAAGSPAPACSAALRVDAQTAGGVRVVASLRNDSPAPVYLLQSERMPYAAVEGADQIVLAWSIQPVPAGVNPGGIQPLATVEIAAGAELHREALLRFPLQVSTHLRGPDPYPGALPDTVKLVAEFGLVAQPLDPAQRHRQSYRALVADQRTCRTAPVTVTVRKP